MTSRKSLFGLARIVLFTAVLAVSSLAIVGANDFSDNGHRCTETFSYSFVIGGNGEHNCSETFSYSFVIGGDDNFNVGDRDNNFGISGTGN